MPALACEAVFGGTQSLEVNTINIKDAKNIGETEAEMNTSIEIISQ